MTPCAVRCIRYLVLSFLLGIFFLVEGNSSAASNADSSPRNLCAVGDKVYFSAEDNIHGRELWECDTSGKCSLVADLKVGPDGSEPTGLSAAGKEYLYFCASPDNSKPHLFFLHLERGELTDFSQSAEGLKGRTVERLYAIEEQVYFLTWPETGNLEIWTTDPGSVSCSRVLILNYEPDVLSSASYHYIIGNTRSYVSCIDSENLSFLDATGNIRYSLNMSSGFLPFRIMGSLSGDREFIAIAHHAKYGSEPVLIKVSTGSTVLIKDIFPGTSSCSIDHEVPFGDRLFFVADDGVHGSELWCSDGSSDGTFMVRDISPGRESSAPYKLCPVDSRFYFAADDGVHGQELWTTDGTEASTRMVADLNPGVASTDLWSFAPFGDQLLFCAKVPEYGEEIFIVNNRSESPRLLKDIVTGSRDSGPHNIVPVGDYFVFTCDDGIHGEELWISDGSDHGTRLAADIASPIEVLSSDPKDLTADAGRVFFSALDHEHGREAWVSDGTEAGSLILHDICPGRTGSAPGPFIKSGKDIFFPATSPECGRELWKSEGTPSTTTLVFDLNVGPDGASIQHLVELDNSLYFTADDGVHGQGLWTLKDTADAPILLLDVAASSKGMEIEDVFSFWNNLYLYAIDDKGSIGLYRFSEEDASLHFLLQEANNIREFIRSHATAQASSTLDESIIYFIRPPYEGRFSYAIFPAKQDTVFFSSHTPENGAELWKTDGTAKGTVLVRDIYPGPPSSGPDQITALGKSVYFIAEAPGEGRILFCSEGTEPSTAPVIINQGAFTWPPIPTNTFAPFRDGMFLVSILPPRSGVSGPTLLKIQDMGVTNRYAFSVQLPVEPSKWPRSLTSTEAGLFFIYQDDKCGTELWVTDATTEGTHIVKDINQ